MLSRVAFLAVLLALLAGALAADAAPLRLSAEHDLVLTHSRFYEPPARPASIADFIASSLKTSDPVQPETCSPCQTVIQIAEWVAESNSSMSLVEALGDNLCAEHFNSSAPALELCTGLVKLLVGFAEKIPGMMHESGLYEPIRFCSAFSMCTVKCCADDTTPEQITLNVGKDATERHVSWVTGGNASASEVRYGINGQFTQRATGYQLTMTTGGYIGTFHRVVITGLQPNEVISYQVGDFSATGSATSPVYTFNTWDAESLKTPFHIGIVGDMAATESPYAPLNIAWLNNQTEAGLLDAVIHIGDIGYGDGYEVTFDTFFTMLQPTMTAVPFVVIGGNHEILFNFSSYEHRFFTSGLGAEPEPLPPSQKTTVGGRHHRAAAAKPKGASTPSGTNLFSSWDLACVHFIGLNSESVLDVAQMDDAQVAWLKADLDATVERMAAGRAAHPDVLETGQCTYDAPTFIVAYLHRPPYCSDTDNMNCHLEGPFLQSVLEPIFVQYGVDLVFSGHQHNYERTHNVLGGKIDPTGPMYVVNGAGGNREGIAHNFEKEAPEWSAFRGALSGVGQLSVLNSSALHLQFFAQPTQNSTSFATGVDAAPPVTLADDVYIYARHRAGAQTKRVLGEEQGDSLVSEM